MRPLSLLVRVALDVSPMWRDDDEPCVHAVIVQAFDKLAVGLRLGVVEGGMWHLRVERSGELAARAEPPAAAIAHTNDVVRAVLADLTDRVQSVLRIVALDPKLMSEGTPNRRELLGVGRAMLLVVDEVLLRGGQSLLD